MGLIFILTFMVSTAHAADETITFKNQETLVKTFSLKALEQLTPQESLRVWEPHEEKNIEYVGYDTKAILDKVYGKAWRSAELILFVCADGYKSPVPRAALEAEKNILAIKRKDSAEFKVHNKAQQQKNVRLAPLYLVWNNLKNKQIKAEGSTRWPYQVIGIELTSFAAKYPHMIPPPNSDAHILSGFQAFQNYCVSCHKIRGDGGDMAPDLSLLLDKKHTETKWLRKWIGSPTSVKPMTSMPPLNKNLANRDEVIDNIIAYLSVMREGSTSSSTTTKKPVPGQSLSK